MLPRKQREAESICNSVMGHSALAASEAERGSPVCRRAGHLSGLQRRPSRSVDEHLPSVAVPCLQPCQHPTGTKHHVQPCWGHGHIHPCCTETSSERFLPHCRFGIERGLHVCSCHLGDNQLKSGVLKKETYKKPHQIF